MSYHLSFEDKVYVVIGCATAVTLAGLIVICFLEYVKWVDSAYTLSQDLYMSCSLQYTYMYIYIIQTVVKMSN